MKGQTRPKGLALQKMFWSGTKQETIRVDSENSWVFHEGSASKPSQQKHGEQVRISCPGPYSPPPHAEVGEGQGLFDAPAKDQSNDSFLGKKT